MKEKYKYMFMKYLYNKLGLKQLEDNLINSGIKMQELDSKEISRFFKILNNVDEGILTGELLEKYNYYFSLEFNTLCIPEIEKEVFKFINETYKLLLFTKTDAKYLYYGPLNYKYMAPSDAIVLGFYYKEFDIDVGDEEFRKIHFKNEVLVANNLNYVQNVLGPENNMKIAVIKYNEIYDKLDEYIKKL